MDGWMCSHDCMWLILRECVNGVVRNINEMELLGRRKRWRAGWRQVLWPKYDIKSSFYQTYETGNVPCPMTESSSRVTIFNIQIGKQVSDTIFSWNSEKIVVWISYVCLCWCQKLQMHISVATIGRSSCSAQGDPVHLSISASAFKQWLSIIVCKHQLGSLLWKKECVCVWGGGQ